MNEISARTSDAARVLDCLAALPRALGAEVASGPGSEPISARQFHALHALVERDRTAGDLARAITITLPNLTQLVDGLVERGWVERYPDPTDRRKVWLSVTERGRQVYTRARDAAEARVADLLSDLSPVERQSLVTGLEVLHSAIHARWRAAKTLARTRPFHQYPVSRDARVHPHPNPPPSRA